MTTHIIYGLRDPRTNQIRYIGKTSNSTRRFRRHISDAECGRNHHVQCWLKTLIKENLKPEMVILEADVPSFIINEREIWWIAEGKRRGWRLTNLTPGGDGVHDPSKETRAKLSAALKGRHPSGETRAKLSAVHKGKKMPPRTAEHCAKIAAGRKGKPTWNKGQPSPRKGTHSSPETCAKQSAALKGKPCPARGRCGPRPEETKQHMRDGWLKRRLEKLAALLTEGDPS